MYLVMDYYGKSDTPHPSSLNSSHASLSPLLNPFKPRLQIRMGTATSQSITHKLSSGHVRTMHRLIKGICSWNALLRYGTLSSF